MLQNNTLNFNLINILSLFLILLPVFLISGSFLSDLTVSLLAVSSFFILRDKKFLKNYYVLFFIFFWIIILSSSFLSENKNLSLKNTIFYFRFCCFSLFVWWILENNKKILKKIYIVLIICFTALIFDSIFQYINDKNIFNMEIVVKNRISSFFGDELIMGSYLMRLFPMIIALSFFFYKKKKHEKFLLPFVLFILLIQITIFLSGERTSFIMFNFSILLFLFFLNDFKKTKILIFLVYIISIALSLTIDSPFKKRIVNLTIEQIQLNDTENPKYIFSKQYHEHYLSAWKMFKDNMLLGIGPKNFRVKCNEENYNFSELTCSTHPHNTPIQLLAETGILSFVIYLLINIVIWFNLIRNLFSKIIYKKKYLNNFQISLLINIAILIWPITPNGNFFNNWLSITLYYPVGFLLWEFRNNEKIYLKSIKKKTFFSKFYFTNNY